MNHWDQSKSQLQVSVMLNKLKTIHWNNVDFRNRCLKKQVDESGFVLGVQKIQ